MTRENFFRVAAFAPLVIPLPAVGVILLARDVPVAIAVGLLILGGSLLYAGIPYILFLSAFLVWSRGRTAPAIRRAALVAPILFAPFCGFGIALVAWFKIHQIDRWLFQQFVSGIVLSLVFGYAYLLTTLAVEQVIFWGAGHNSVNRDIPS